MYALVCDRERDGEGDRVVVAVDLHRVGVGAVGERGEMIAGGDAGAVENEFGKALQIGQSEFGEHRDEPPASGFVACRERVDVADHLIGLANVVANDVDQVLVA